MPFPAMLNVAQPRSVHDIYDEGVQQRHVVRLPMRAFAAHSPAVAQRFQRADGFEYPTCLAEVLVWRGGLLELRDDRRPHWYDLGVLPQGLTFIVRTQPGSDPLQTAPVRLSGQLRATNNFHWLMNQDRGRAQPFLWLLTVFLQPNLPPCGLLLTRVGYWEVGNHSFARNQVPEVGVEATADVDPRLVDVQTGRLLHGYDLRNWANTPVNHPPARGE